MSDESRLRAPTVLREELDSLRQEGLIRSIGRGRGTKLVLDPEHYEKASAAALLPRESIKTAVLEHIASRGDVGSSTGELLDQFPELTRDRLKSILEDLKARRRV